MIRGTQRSQVFASGRFVARRKLYGWKVEPPQHLAQPDTRAPAVEVGERVNGEQAPFCKGERLQQNAAGLAGGGQTGLQVEAVFANERRHLEEVRRLVLADGDVRSPPAGKLRHEVAADQGMKPKEKRVVENGVFELAVFDSLLECQDVARQMRRELGVA